MKVRISHKANEDIMCIYLYLEDVFGISVADRKIANLYRDINHLINNPFMGKSVYGKDQNLRTLFSKPNIILYDINNDVIEILHILDGRSNWINTV